MITPGFIKRYHYNWAFSSAKAIDELGYHITPLEDGMKRTMEWLNTKI
jgi:farnesol dehydrogenase